MNGGKSFREGPKPVMFPYKSVPYLQGRIAQVFDAPNEKRPRWTVTDAHAVRAVLAVIGVRANEETIEETQG